METFEITVQDPMKSKPDALGKLDAPATMRAFESIDWFQWGLNVMHANGDAEAFYFFEAKRAGEKRMEPLLCISGQFVGTESEMHAQGALCQIDHFFLETEISRGFLGLGGGKSKQVLNQRTMQDCSVEFAQRCLQAFLDGDTEFLAKEVIDNASDD
jgi:hypothetical protein